MIRNPKRAFSLIRVRYSLLLYENKGLSVVAMQLSAKYKKPTIIARLNNEGYVRGSSRGINNSELESFKDFMDSTGLFEYTAG